MTDNSYTPAVQRIDTVVHDADRLQAAHTANANTTADASLVFDRLTTQASELLHAPLALISLVDSDRDIILGQVGLPPAIAQSQEIKDSPSFCQLTIAQDGPVIINDTHAVPTLRLFPSVQNSGVRAHLGIPLTYQGQPVGNCCVIDFKPRNWTSEDVQNITKLAAEAMQELNAPASS